MRRDDNIYKNYFERYYRIVGNYLAVYAWSHGKDCLIIPKSTLKWILDFEKFREQSSDDFQEGIKGWFPHAYPLKKRKTGLASIYISRVPIVDGDGRIRKDLSTIVFKDSTLNESVMITYLTLLASGLDEPIQRVEPGIEESKESIWEDSVGRPG